MSNSESMWYPLLERVVQCSDYYWQTLLHHFYVRQQGHEIWLQLREWLDRVAQLSPEQPLSHGERVLIHAAAHLHEVGWQQPDSPKWSQSDRYSHVRDILLNDSRLSGLYDLPQMFLESLIMLCTSLGQDVRLLPLIHPIGKQTTVRLRYLSALFQLADMLFVDRIKLLPVVNWDVQGDPLNTMRLLLSPYISLIELNPHEIVFQLRLHPDDFVESIRIEQIIIEPIIRWLHQNYEWLKGDAGFLLQVPKISSEAFQLYSRLETINQQNWLHHQLQKFEATPIGDLKQVLTLDTLSLPEPVCPLVDFVLHIDVERRRSAHSPDGQAEDNQPIPQVEASLKLALKLIDNNQIDKNTLQASGKMLFDILFPPKIEVLFRTTRSKYSKVRIRLRIEPSDLALLPWEFTYDEQRSEYISCQTDIPLTRFLPRNLPFVSLRVREPRLKFLLIISNPTQYHPPLDGGAWENSLRDALISAPVDVSTVEPNRAAIETLLQRESFHIVQFVGHGDYWQGNGVLALCAERGGTDPVDEDWFSHLFIENKPALVALAACRSSASTSPYQFSGVAQKLLHVGIPAVIAMQYAVLNSTALGFFTQFYKAVASGVAVDTAVQKARHFVAQVQGMDNREFGTPTLYFRAVDGDLFGSNND